MCEFHSESAAAWRRRPRLVTGLPADAAALLFCSASFPFPRRRRAPPLPRKAVARGRGGGKAGFPASATHPTQGAMTSLLDWQITAASGDGVCRWHAAKLWQTRAKLLKLNLIFIVSCTTGKRGLDY